MYAYISANRYDEFWKAHNVYASDEFKDLINKMFCDDAD